MRYNVSFESVRLPGLSRRRGPPNTLGFRCTLEWGARPLADPAGAWFFRRIFAGSRSNRPPSKPGLSQRGTMSTLAPVHTRKHDAEAHRFAVGQVVRLRGRSGDWPLTGELYHVTGTLPARDNALQYRIRNDGERYERVAIEDDLELVRAAAPVVDNAAPRWTPRPPADGRTAKAGVRRAAAPKQPHG